MRAPRRIRVLAVLLCSAWFAGAFGVTSAKADPFPPWFDVEQGFDPLEVSSHDYERFTRWYIDQQLEPDFVEREEMGFALYLILEVAYSFGVPGSENAEVAVSLAERTSLRWFDGKEVVLADLKYAPDGIAPDPEQYAHSIFKSALFLTQSIGMTMFPAGARDMAPSDFMPAYHQWFSKAFFDAFNAAYSDTDGFGDQSAIEIAREVLRAIPNVEAHIGASTKCSLLHEAQAYMTGDTPVGADLEMAELLLNAAEYLNSDDYGDADVLYQLGVSFDQLRVLYRVDSKDDYFEMAASYGHPEASFLVGKRALREDRLRDALEHFAVAHLQGHSEAGDLFSTTQDSHGFELDEGSMVLARFDAAQYQKHKC